MCGFAGVLDAAALPADALREVARRMSATLAHRGPDDAGDWADPAAGVAFGFRRLSIVDLSPEGHQPMTSAGGRFTVVFNGEVYNHVELREALEQAGERFRGRSDTEVMLACFERWGVRGSLPRFVGMFALAVWDAAERTLHLARDRMGIKPLFIHHRPGRLLFGSELKALRACAGWDAEVDPDALAAYLRHLYVPAPGCILRGVLKLPPGTLLSIRDVRAPLPQPVAWWSVREAALAGARAPFRGDDEEAVDEAERVIGDAVALRMRADVPLGAFLSGGIDSSLVVALMQARSVRAVRTFTIGFGEAEWDESAHAASVAHHLGTDHTDARLSPADALALVPSLPDWLDEPLADPSALPTLLVSRIARRHVTVALSGDGGDELFAGYHRYRQGEAAILRALRVPRWFRVAGAAGVRRVSPAAWDGAFARLGPLVPPSMRHRLPGDKLHKLAALLAEGGAPRMYRSLVSQWGDPAALVPGAVEAEGAADEALAHAPLPLLSRMMLSDQLAYLPDDLLAKVDRASMAVGLEARVPLLDHRVVELSWRLPRHLKVRGGEGKWILRRILQRHVPDSLVDRPKMGFSVPVGAWLRGPLRPWAEDLLSADALHRTGLIDPVPVRKAWGELVAGQGRHALAMWAVLVFQAWHARWMQSAAAPVPAGAGG
jgi:asparagine synthase (glutamine-hydrolysing)